MNITIIRDSQLKGSVVNTTCGFDPPRYKLCRYYRPYKASLSTKPRWYSASSWNKRSNQWNRHMVHKFGKKAIRISNMSVGHLLTITMSCFLRDAWNCLIMFTQHFCTAENLLAVSERAGRACYPGALIIGADYVGAWWLEPPLGNATMGAKPNWKITQANFPYLFSPNVSLTYIISIIRNRRKDYILINVWIVNNVKYVT